ncbi:MAG: hypothetical protein K2Q97_12030, partial [Burkholderiaceae bacterium]|nr:hypothetical protein [Burkholderiaceae bacterium]
QVALGNIVTRGNELLVKFEKANKGKLSTAHRMQAASRERRRPTDGLAAQKLFCVQRTAGLLHSLVQQAGSTPV